VEDRVNQAWLEGKARTVGDGVLAERSLAAVFAPRQPPSAEDEGENLWPFHVVTHSLEDADFHGHRLTV